MKLLQVLSEQYIKAKANERQKLKEFFSWLSAINLI